MSNPDKSNAINIQLGDIIEIDAPTNNDIDKQTFIVDYIDNKKLVLINSSTLEKQTLLLDDTGGLTDKSITSISILDRSNTEGYAKQNNLIPQNWIDIYFGGDLPTTITGQITNLEEDMIEIKTFPDNDIIYIDFGYKGIPEDLPIEKINIREAPEAIKPTEDVEVVIPEDKETDGTEEEVVVEAPLEEIKGQIKEMLLDAEQVQIGAEMDAITQVIEVPEEQKRYGIENQANDLLDELLSTIPNAERTRSVINNLHIMIERFKQLRTEYSVFDKNGNAQMPKLQGANFKPLVSHLYDLNQKLYWILPIAKNKKKLYDIDVDEENEYPDIVPLTLAETRIAEDGLTELYKTNTDDYSTYMNKLNPYLTPYENPNAPENLLTSKVVDANITSVIDNLEDLYSSVAKNDTVKKRRFVIQKYNLGLNKLHASELKGSRMVAHRVPMTPADTISIKSMLTLPESAFRFSHINLPSTNILDKTSLNRHFLNYWQLLRRDTSVTTTIIDNLDTPLEFDSKTFLNDIKEFILDETLTDEDKYKKYLEVIIPKTRILFELVKKYIKGKLSLYDVIGYLEPFMIYHRDLSFKQYEEIVGFIKDRILDYKKSFATKGREYKLLRSTNYNVNLSGAYMLFDLLKNRDSNAADIFEAYGITPEKFSYKEDGTKFVLTSSAIITKMINIDYMKLYTSAIAKITVDLMNPDFVALFDEGEKVLEQKMERAEGNNECKKYTLAKKYYAIDELNDDNDIDTFFDKQFDKTDYTIVKEYRQQQSSMSTEDFKEFLTDQLMKNIGLDKSTAQYDAESMISGRKKIKDDQYAVVEVEEGTDTNLYYYKREDNKWVKDDDVSEDAFIDTPKTFCVIQKNCFPAEDKCVNDSAASDLIKKNAMKEIYDEFDENYHSNIQRVTKDIISKFEYNFDNIIKLRDLIISDKYKYDDKHYDIGTSAEEVDIIVSPYEKLRGLILGQSDFVKKQYDIAKFIDRYTRTPIDEEDEFWLYCIDTNTKLLPSFFETLSTAFIDGFDYLVTADTICKDRGTISDDGEAWVDKHSGYVIKRIDPDVEEGYNETGFKLQSREILEKDLGNAILQAPEQGEGKKVFDNPNANVINNIITTMANFMGIDLDAQREFIISNTLVKLEEAVGSEEEHAAKSKRFFEKRGKKLPSYDFTLNQTMLLFTLAYITIAIQSSVPSIKTRKTHPGCKRSFVGYPLDGTEDLSGIVYVACIADKIKSSIEPWNTLKKIKSATIATKIKLLIDTSIITDPLIQEKLQEKRNYLQQTEEDYIPVEHDIDTWINFLPPLKNIKRPSPINITSEFKTQFLNDLKKGSKDQYEKLGVIQGKVIYFSLAIQQLIQKIIEKQEPLITNSNKEPFLENTCCHSEQFNTLRFFIDKDSSIGQYNRITNDLNNILVDVTNIDKAPTLFNPQDTKLQYPPMSTEFSEGTIYRAFITFCKFNKSVLINDSLRAICMDKPDDFDINDSIDDKIKKLKRDGRNYSEEALQQLLQVVNKQNIVKMNLSHSEVTIIQRMRDILIHLDDTSSDKVPEPLQKHLTSILDTYDVSLTEDTEDMRALKNYLARSNSEMEGEIISFIRNNGKLSRTKRASVENFIKTFMDFKLSGDGVVFLEKDETLYKTINFVKNSLHNLTDVLPNIILNNVDYTNINIPRHWKLTERHNSDIKNIITTYYEKLKPFYDEETLKPLLEKIQINTKDLHLLALNTPFFSEIKNKDGSNVYSIFDYRTSSLLFRYYLLSIFTEYIALKDDTAIIVKEVIPPKEETNIISSTEVEEEATGVITSIEIVQGEKQALSEKMAKLLATFIDILAGNKSVIDYNMQSIMERATRVKDKEKDTFTTYLGDLTEEVREVENIKKNHRLGKWGKGLQKGLYAYEGATYDEERAELEKHAEREKKLGQHDYVTDMNKEIYMFEDIENERVSEEIERDANDLSQLAEDDDYGENDGDM